MQVPDAIRKCVGFVGAVVRPGEPELGGTFFLVEHEGFVYAVTAAHVYEGVRSDGKDALLHLKVNLRVGQAQWVPTQLADWTLHPTDRGADVAVLPFGADWRVLDHAYFPMSMALTPEVAKERFVGIGDEVFLTGLFTRRPGNGRNIPILRTGAIAAMPDEPIEWKRDSVDGDTMESMSAYLVEARSIGGLSGSPVFVFMGGTRVQGQSVMTVAGLPMFYLLGLMHGHWDAPLDGPGAHRDETPDIDTAAIKAEMVNMGIGMVVPVETIREVLDQPKLKAPRDAAAEARRLADTPTPAVPDQRPTPT